MRHHILIVDGSSETHQLLGALSALPEHVIESALSAELVLETNPDDGLQLIFIDLTAPGSTGTELCRRLKLAPGWQQIPTILLGARSANYDFAHGFAVGADDYLLTPINEHELLARVRTFLKLNLLRRELDERTQELVTTQETSRRTLGRFVSEDVANNMLDSPAGRELGGEERVVTILMSDLRGFSAMSTDLGPQSVIEVLNIYLETMVDVIGSYQGTIDEIIGDAILVIFGAPVASPDHAARAVACALAMQLAMSWVNQQLAAIDAPSIEMGIGIHSGPVVVGNIGSAHRMKYAAVGPNVNLTGRIESFSTGGQILISEHTHAKIDVPLRIDSTITMKAKGASASMTLYEVSALGAPYSLELPQNQEALTVLDQPATFRYLVLEDKFLGETSYEGKLHSFSDRHAEITTETPLSHLSNVKMTLESTQDGFPGGVAYGKVVKEIQADTATARVRFTSLDAPLRNWIDQRVTVT